MNHKRPINLDLTTLHFPVMAITSIMHRLSGIAVFLLLPFMLYVLQASLSSEESFKNLVIQLHQPIFKALLWVFISALFYHFMAGVRHMIGDLGYGEEVYQARVSATILIVLTIISTVVIGAWIW